MIAWCRGFEGIEQFLALVLQLQKLSSHLLHHVRPFVSTDTYAAIVAANAGVSCDDLEITVGKEFLEYRLCDLYEVSSLDTTSV